jgi:hypothetical protein
MLIIHYIDRQFSAKEEDMPYREKVAWLSLVAICIAFVPYFAHEAEVARAAHGVPSVQQVLLFSWAVVVQVAVLAAGHAYFRVRTPEEATAPPDERDRAIARRSITWAYAVVVAGMILVGCLMPFQGAGRWLIINAALLVIVLAELVRYGAVVFSYRRQA